MRRFFGIIGALSLASVAVSACAAGPALAPAVGVVNASAIRRRRKAVAAGTLAKYRRGKRAPQKRKIHSNRLHMSRRVRRRHRRG